MPEVNLSRESFAHLPASEQTSMSILWHSSVASTPSSKASSYSLKAVSTSFRSSHTLSRQPYVVAVGFTFLTVFMSSNTCRVARGDGNLSCSSCMFGVGTGGEGGGGKGGESEHAGRKLTLMAGKQAEIMPVRSCYAMLMQAFMHIILSCTMPNCNEWYAQVTEFSRQQSRMIRNSAAMQRRKAL